MLKFTVPSITLTITLLTTTLLLALVACGPKRGYTGPKLPPDQISLIEVSKTNSAKQTLTGHVDGQTFDSAGIEVLPQEQVIDVDAAFRYEPYSCRQEESFNEYGYQSCLDDRDKAIAKGKSKLPYCSPDAYRSTSTTCAQDTAQYGCSIKISTKAGRRYVIFAGELGEKKAEITVRELPNMQQEAPKQGSTPPAKSTEWRAPCSFVGVSTDDVTL